MAVTRVDGMVVQTDVQMDGMMAVEMVVQTADSWVG